MAYEALEQNLARFEQSLSDLKMVCPADSSVGVQLNLTREFIGDQRALSEKELSAKWDSRFRDFYNAQFVVTRLSESIATLASHHSHKLRDYLKKIFAGELTQGIESSQAKDFLYELWLASSLLEHGFDVELREPDIVVSGNQLRNPLGIACKFPSSESQVHAHITKGYKQIRNQSLEGIVSIGIDLIVLREAFPNGLKYLDFRQGDSNPLEVTQKLVDHAAMHLKETRSTRFPSEVPIDGLLLTLTIGGIMGPPAKLCWVTAMSLQCDSSSPLLCDLERIRDQFSTKSS